MGYLITGANGFIGSYVLREFLKFQNVYASRRNPKNNIKCQLSREPIWINKSFYEISKRDLKDIKVIVHLSAAGVSPKVVSKNEIYEINVDKTFDFFKKAINSGIELFISCGTCLEYGMGGNGFDKIPTYAELLPLSDYGKSKAIVFKKMYEYSRNKNIKFLHLRLFNVYGIGQYKNNLWPSLYSAASKGEDFSIKNGNLIRDFVKVEDVAKFIFNCSFGDDLISGKPKVMNYGSGEGISLEKFAKNEWKRLKAKGNLRVEEFKNDLLIQRIVSDNKVY